MSSRVVDGDVLPDANNMPARLHQGGIRGAVSLNVPLQLGRPVPLVVRRLASVLWTDVPKASVDEDGHSGLREDQVGSHTSVRQVQLIVLAEASPSTVQEGPQGDLGLRVGPTDRGEVPSATLGDWGWLSSACCGSRVWRCHWHTVGRPCWERAGSWGRMARMSLALPVIVSGLEGKRS